MWVSINLLSSCQHLNLISLGKVINVKNWLFVANVSTVDKQRKSCLFSFSFQYHRRTNHIVNRGILLEFFQVLFCSTLLHLPPLRFHCDGGTQACCDCDIGSQTLITTRLDLIHKGQISSTISLTASRQYSIPMISDHFQIQDYDDINSFSSSLGQAKSCMSYISIMKVKIHIISPPPCLS